MVGKQQTDDLTPDFVKKSLEYQQRQAQQEALVAALTQPVKSIVDLECLPEHLRQRYNDLCKQLSSDDWRAIQSDWRVVGDDMRVAMGLKTKSR